jgi:Sulfatase-modifying factor enzyme 1
MRWLPLVAALLVALPVGAVNIHYVGVRDPGNPPDTTGLCFAANCGSVPYDYAIAKYETTNAQYTEFLNAVAAPDTYGLWNPAMHITYPVVPIGFKRVYIVDPGFENKPVVYVSFWDAVRFANWLHNGEPFGVEDATTTEDGAYTLTPTGIANNAIVRNFGANVFVTSENEWYKAAYYSPGGTYFDYAGGTDMQTACAGPAADMGNSANCGSVVGGLTNVGAYGLSASPYGTFDQAGNVSEWNEQTFGALRAIRGGAWGSGPWGASNLVDADSTAEFPDVGFRVARPLPEPARVLLGLTGGLVLGAVRRRRA